MKILFDIGLPPHIRHYDNVIANLKSRGHDVIVSTSLADTSLFAKQDIDQDHRNVILNVLYLPHEPWAEQAYFNRALRDAVKYLDPEYSHSNLLRGRILNMLQHGLSEPFQKAGNTALEFIQKLSPTERMAFSNLLGQLDEAGPTSKKLEKFLLNHRPDFLLITPLIFTQYGQFELLKAAKKLSIPVGYLVFSWDNLSTKGVLQINPDAIFLWNEIQRDEVLSKYNFPQEKIYVCGAPRFDYFFEKKPSLSRDQYFQKFDLNPEKKVVTYLCSSNLISNAESDFVIRWLNSIRSSSAPLLKNCNVVIRPHPKFRAQWENFEVPASEGKTTISSSKGLNNDPLLFDTLYFTDVVVGLNTSAQLEAAVLNKPVLTLNVPEFSEGQEGTIHFHYLLKEKGGFVRRASSLETHLEDLKSVLGGDIDSEVIKNFVKKFIRPQGLDKSAADATVDSIEFFASKVVRSGARRSSVWKRLLGS